MAASVKPSRFALLKIEDDDSENEENSKEAASIQIQSKLKKSKGKKKKPEQSAQETAELRSLAFGLGSRGKARNGTNKSVPIANDTDSQWKEWEKLDKEHVEGAFEKELEEALLLSKLELEKKKNGVAIVEEGASGDSCSVGVSKKKKKKKENKTISLQEFNSPPEAPPNDKLIDRVSPPADPDPQFFDRTHHEAQKMVQKEKIQEAYKKTYVAEHARAQQYQELITEKENEISKLKTANEEVAAELKQVKKRNQQLCFILSQGEMKEKTAVLMELDELKGVRDELSQEVTQLTMELEKERSKVHALESDLKKSKNGKSAK